MTINKREPGSEVSATLTTSDIEIGAVEIKDGTTDNRAKVDSSGRVYIHQDSTKVVSASGIISAPTATTNYYSDTVDISGTKTVTIFVYADQAIDVTVLATLLGQEAELAGAQITNTDFVAGQWNYIHLPIPLESIRVKFTTGTTPPTDIKWVIKGVL